MSELEGQNIIINKAKVLDSDFGGTYLLMDCVDGSGERFSVATSAQNVLDVVKRLLDMDALPVVVTLEKVKTRRGRQVWTVR